MKINIDKDELLNVIKDFDNINTLRETKLVQSDFKSRYFQKNWNKWKCTHDGQSYVHIDDPNSFNPNGYIAQIRNVVQTNRGFFIEIADYLEFDIVKFDRSVKDGNSNLFFYVYFKNSETYLAHISCDIYTSEIWINPNNSVQSWLYDHDLTFTDLSEVDMMALKMFLMLGDKNV